MRIFLESIKRSFKEVAGRWWFLIAFLSREIVGLLTSCVGIILMFAKGDIYSSINYDWTMSILRGSMPRIIEQSPDTITSWVFERSLLLFVVYLIAYYFLGIVGTKPKNNANIRLILRNTAIVFFLVNVIISIVAPLIAYITHDVYNPYLPSLFHFFSPFSFSSYVLIGVIMLAKKEGISGKIVLNLVGFEYLLFVVESVIYYLTPKILCQENTSNAVIVSRIPTFTADRIIIAEFVLSFVLFLFSLFIYAFVIDGEKFFHSLLKGISFTFRHLQYALILSLVVYFFTELAFKYISINLFHIAWHQSINFHIENFYTFLNQYLRIATITIAYNFYKLKKLAV